MGKQTNKNTFSRELAGILYLSASILIAFSLFSYDWHDIRYLNETTNHPTANWIGIIGAYLAFGLYWLIGWASNFLPFITSYLGISSLFRKNYRLQESSIWMLVFLLSASCFIQVLGLGETSWTKKINTAHLGGIWGYFLGTKIFWEYLKHGAVISFGLLSCGSLFMAAQLKPIEIYHWIIAQWEAHKEQKQEKVYAEKVERREKAIRSGDIKTVLKTREEEMVERQKMIAKELARREKTIKDHKEKTSTSAKSEDVPRADPSSQPSALKPKEVETIESAAPAPTTNQSPPEKTDYKITTAQKPKKPKRPIVQNTLFGPYQLPPLDLLKYSTGLGEADSKEEIAKRGALIERTLKDFSIDVQMGEITQGATITRFEVIPSPGVKVERIVNLQNNLSLALKAEKVNILAPVAGKGTVGIEVANATKAPVVIRELIESSEFQKSHAKIPLALGKDVYGKTLIADLADMPHLLIAGSTGAGKSVCINSIVNSLLYKFSPDDLRLILIDPKVVELQTYNTLPHLIIPVVSDPKKVIMALRWVIREMEKRYTVMAKVGVRNIQAFNSRPKSKPTASPDSDGGSPSAEEPPAQPLLIPEEEIIVPEKFPYIVVFVDELADLMLTAPVDAEDAITRITQMARAAGIHLIVATQTPRADVVTGTIKTNLPAKIAFRVASKIDSRVILDENGAENLLGKGDMMYKSSDSGVLRRAQGAFISDEEVRTVVNCCAKQVPVSYDIEIHEKLSKPVSQSEDEEASEEDEELLEKCLQVIKQENRASTSLLQRRLRLGYTRAARMMDLLEERGYVGPSQGAKDREILIRMDGASPV